MGSKSPKLSSCCLGENQENGLGRRKKRESLVFREERERGFLVLSGPLSREALSRQIGRARIGRTVGIRLSRSDVVEGARAYRVTLVPQSCYAGRVHPSQRHLSHIYTHTLLATVAA